MYMIMFTRLIFVAVVPLLLHLDASFAVQHRVGLRQAPPATPNPNTTVPNPNTTVPTTTTTVPTTTTTVPTTTTTVPTTTTTVSTTTTTTVPTTTTTTVPTTTTTTVPTTTTTTTVPTTTTTVPTTTPYPIIPRKSYMCKCINPRRPGGVDNPSDVDIPDIRTAVPPHPLQGCFDFQLVNCPVSPTGEVLGAVFTQKFCPAFPDLMTLEVSFVAMNELGFPYGELSVNKLIRTCYDNSGIVGVRPIVHHMDPLGHKCPGFAANQTQYGTKEPEWLSIVANITVPPGTGNSPPSNPAAVQVILVDKIMSTNPRPSMFFMIAEFAVQQTPTSSPEILRITTGQLEDIQYGSTGTVDFGASRHVFPATIVPNPEYIGEEVTTNPPVSPCEVLPGKPPKPTPPPDFMCRCFHYFPPNPSDSPPDHNPLEKCTSIVMNVGAISSSPASVQLYVSMQSINTSGCENVTLQQVVLIMLTRDITSTTVNGEWEQVNYTSDLVPGKCVNNSLPSLKSRGPYRFNIQSCASFTDNRLYWSYKPLIAGDIVCGSWKFVPASNVPITEIQLGYVVHFTNGSLNIRHQQLHPKIFEVLRESGNRFTVDVIASERNPRIELQLPQPTPPIGCHHPPVPRKTEMCECVSPRRAHGVPVIRPDADKVIPDVNTTRFGTCFNFTMVGCPRSLTSDNLGALFFQNFCPGFPNLTTVDVSVIAINEEGYPYGKLTVNQYSRSCMTTKDIVERKPVLHWLDPVSFPCPNLYLPEKSKYDRKIPEWLSIAANLVVENDPQALPAVLQISLVDMVQTGAPHPAELQFVAEFTVIPSEAERPETIRIKTRRHKLAFDAAGKVDFAASPALPTDIEVNPDYLDVDASTFKPPIKLSCHGVPPSSPPPPPHPSPDWLLCRCLEWENGVQVEDKVKDCYNVTINNEPSNSLTFYASLEKLAGSSGGCDQIEISEIFFTMFVRDSQGISNTRVIGSWGKVNDSVDYTPGKCLWTASTVNPKAAGKFHRQSCQGQDYGLYYFYRGLKDPGDIICGKWTLSSPPQQDFELQLGYKMLYSDGTNTKLMYGKRHSEIHEVVVRAGGGYEVSLVSVTDNNRIELFLPALPTTTKPPCIITPFIPSSHVCDCTQLRHQGFHQDPITSVVTPVSAATPPIPEACFEFNMVPCSEDGQSYNTIGAIFIINPNPACSVDITVEDIAFQAMQEDGFPFGEIFYHRYLRSCILPNEMIDKHVKNLDFMNPLSGLCDKRLDADQAPFTPIHFKYPAFPNWLEINTNASVRDMKTPLVIQIYFKRVIGASASKIQLIAEMVIKHAATRAIHSLKTPVYSIRYDASGAYDSASLTPTQDPDIILNPEYYESDISQATCRGPEVPGRQGNPQAMQYCGCVDFPNAWRLPFEDPYYHSKFNNCINFEWTTKVSAKYGAEAGEMFFLSIFADSASSACSGLNIVGVAITPLRQQYNTQTGIKENPNSQFGVPYGGFEQTTYAPPPAITLGQDCPLPASYTGQGGKLRRLPVTFKRLCTKGGGQMLYFYYPLLNQPDKADGFCAALIFPEEVPGRGVPPSRFEFQLVGEFFVEDTTTAPPTKYIAMKRTYVFEYFPFPISGVFPGKIFPVAAVGDNPVACDVDICLMDF